MSKLIDMLERVGYEPPSPFGFSTASKKSDTPPAIALVGAVSLKVLTKQPKLAEAPVDAVLVSLDTLDEKKVDKIADRLESRLWGLQLNGVDKTQAGTLKEKGCDFVLFEPDNTAASILSEEDIGKLVSVDPDLSEEMARAIHQLSIDAAVLTAEGDLAPLTVRKAMDYMAIQQMIGKSLLITAPAALGPDELEPLRDMGIAGLVVDLTSPDEIAGTREAIENLPRPKRRSQRRNALVPQVTADQAEHVHEHPDEDDDDDF